MLHKAILEFAVMIVTHHDGSILQKCMNYLHFVLQLVTKNTLKLTPLDTELFSCFIVTISTCKDTNKLLLVYANMIHPMQNQECVCGHN